MSQQAQTWNSELYQSSHSYIWEYGRELLDLLAAKSGERILDVGCGTGQLTAEAARHGANVTGIDASVAMIESAQKNYPHLRFEVADAAALPYATEFDAVISNAALHWVRDQQGAIASMARALKPRGRLVLEMGGRGNLLLVLEAACEALAAMGVAEPQELIPWYFPSIGEYAPQLEAHGLEVRFAVLFDRPTPLEDGENGFAAWMRMLGSFAVSAVPAEQQPELRRRWEDNARRHLLRNGTWIIDHVRLRMLATKR